MNRQQILHKQATLKQKYEKKEIAPTVRNDKIKFRIVYS